MELAHQDTAATDAPDHSAEIDVDLAEPGDWHELRRMGRELHDEARAHSAGVMSDADLQRLFEQLVGEHADRALFVARADGRAVGMMAATLVRSFFAADFTNACELFVWVDKDARRSGVAARLLEALEAWAKRHGAKRVVIGSMMSADVDALQAIAKRHDYQQANISWAKEI